MYGGFKGVTILKDKNTVLFPITRVNQFCVLILF